MLTVDSPDDLRIEVRVPQSDAEAIRAQPGARVVFDGGASIDARQVVVYPSADPLSHSVVVRVLLPNMDLPVPPGTTAKSYFRSAATARVCAFPKPRSFSPRRTHRGAYALKDGTLTLRQLRLGTREGEMIEALAGLRPGDVVARDPEAALQALKHQREASGAGHE